MNLPPHCGPAEHLIAPKVLRKMLKSVTPPPFREMLPGCIGYISTSGEVVMYGPTYPAVLPMRRMRSYTDLLLAEEMRRAMTAIPVTAPKPSKSAKARSRKTAKRRAKRASAIGIIPSSPEGKVYYKTELNRFSHTMLTKAAILRCGNFQCAYCGCQLNLVTMTLDHIHPKSRGGTNDPGNLAAACNPCNTKKGDKTMLMKFPPTHL